MTTKDIALRRVQEGAILQEKLQRSLHQKKTERDQEMRETGPNHEYVLAMGNTTVGPGEDAVIHSIPTIAFWPQRLIIPSTIASDFFVVGMRIGLNSTSLAVPAIVFSESRSGYGFIHNFGVSHPDRGITLHVRNTANGRREFMAAFIGPIRS